MGRTGLGDASPADWLPVEEALDRVLAACAPLPVERADLHDALGRALAADVVSRVDQPPWDNSAMDGFAVRSEDVAGASEKSPVVLPVVDDVPAGGFPKGPIEPGTAVRVMTGAPVPAGASGVIRIEHTDGGVGGRVTIRLDSDASRNIRSAGEDLRKNRTTITAGTEVTPAVVGQLAAMGHATIDVHRRPRVAVLSNGDELVDFDRFDEVVAGRRIMNSNGHALRAMLAQSGVIPVPLGIAADDGADVMRRIESASQFDVLLTSAGVSVGDHDHVKAALESLGLEGSFWRVRMRPGSPMTFGLLDGRPVFGLPGNPVSVMVTSQVFVRPALRALGGHVRVRPRRMRVRAAEDIASPADLTHFFRVQLEMGNGGELQARLTGPQGSGILRSMVIADALAIVPEGCERIRSGEPLEVLPLGEWAG